MCAENMRGYIRRDNRNVIVIGAPLRNGHTWRGMCVSLAVRQNGKFAEKIKSKNLHLINTGRYGGYKINSIKLISYASAQQRRVSGEKFPSAGGVPR